MNTHAQTELLAIVILAAGKGTRMKSASPKLLHPVVGRSMIATLLETAQSLNPQKIIVVVGQNMNELAHACDPHEIAIQAEQNGTGGAVKAAAPLLKDFTGKVLILLGDAPLITRETMVKLMDAKGNKQASILGCEVQNASGYGRLIMAGNGALDAIVEHKDASEEERKINLINTGAFCVDGAGLHEWLDKLDSNNAQGEFYITQLPEIINAEHGTVNIAVTHDESEVQGANTRAQLAELENTMQNRLRARAMENGVSLIDPNTVYFSYDTHIENDVVIEPNVFFGKNVQVKSGVHIKAFTHIEGAVIENGATIGPFARIRPDTHIGENARVGNFVEIKKSDIGAGAKIGHLAYVGDCDMGAEVNFSAGAITVNYDGFNKHRTTLGKGVMVGSNANLVAPVNIGDGAFVAAGSTISKDVSADALSIAREKSREIKGWAAKNRISKESSK